MMPLSGETPYPDAAPLSEREREVLRLVVQHFIQTAGPVGSRFLAEHSALGVSAASIRNAMNRLEEQGYLDHPYTSAGRVPTPRGYRTYVDELMAAAALSSQQQQQLVAEMERDLGDVERLLRESSRLLGRLTNLLGVALSPRLSTGVLERLEVVPLSSERVMFVVSVRGGLVRTIVVHVESALPRRDLERVVGLLNERLAGLTLAEIRRTYEERVRDVDDGCTGIVQLVLRESPTLFSEEAETRRLQIGGTQNILAQPEFQEPADLRSLIALLEDEGSVVQLFEGVHGQGGDVPIGRAAIRIGPEIVGGEADGPLEPDELERLSVVTACYGLGDTIGTVGVIGPTRMDYARVVALVEGMAALLDRPADGTRH